MSIKDRIDEFMSYKGLTVKAFEQEIGISNGLWAKAKTVSEDVLLKTIAHFPEINSGWLLKGTGDMCAPEGNDMCAQLLEENRKLREELARMNNPEQADKNERIYSLWVKFMEVASEMQELYKERR